MRRVLQKLYQGRDPLTGKLVLISAFTIMRAKLADIPLALSLHCIAILYIACPYAP